MKSKSGRELTPFPLAKSGKRFSPQNEHKKLSEWLIENAKIEAQGNEHLSFLLSRITLLKGGHLTTADAENLNDILFGKPVGIILTINNLQK